MLKAHCSLCHFYSSFFVLNIKENTDVQWLDLTVYSFFVLSLQYSDAMILLGIRLKCTRLLLFSVITFLFTYLFYFKRFVTSVLERWYLNILSMAFLSVVLLQGAHLTSQKRRPHWTLEKLCVTKFRVKKTCPATCPKCAAHSLNQAPKSSSWSVCTLN